MKICHFADTHIGVSTEGPTDPESGLNGRVLDFLDSLDCLILYCEENEADIALFAGDAFHRHSPNSLLLNEYTRRIRRLSMQCPVVLLIGNHDVPYSVTDNVSSVEVYKSLEQENIIVANGYDVLPIETKHGTLQVVTFPYPSKRIFPNKEDISIKIGSLAKRVKHDSPCVFLGHFSVTGAKYGSERAFIMSKEAEVESSWLDKGPWDYVALGHLHMHQCINESSVPPIVYAGSIDRVDFGEEHEDKGFVWLEISEESIYYYFVSVSPRPMMTLDYSFTKNSKAITTTILDDIRSRDLRNCIVRVRISLPEHMTNSLRMASIHEALSECYFVHSVNISRLVEAPESRLGESDTPLTALPSLELLDRYFTNVTGAKGKEKRQLLKLAESIMEDCNDQL